MTDQTTKQRTRQARYEETTDRTTVRVRLTPAELARLDAARQTGETRSDCIRRGIEALLTARSAQ